MPAVVLDACGILNLYASGRFVSVLAEVRHDWYMPAAVERESNTYRQADPEDPDKLVVAKIDFEPAIGAGVLRRCDCDGEEELALYVELAARIGDDGESMGLAIAKCRGWAVLTDDKKARRVADELGVEVMGTTEVMRRWAEATRPSRTELAEVLRGIERFARYRPGRWATEYGWWMEAVREGEV